MNSRCGIFDSISLYELNVRADTEWVVVVLLVIFFLDPCILVKFIGANLNELFELLKYINLESHHNTIFILDLICKKTCKF